MTHDLCSLLSINETPEHLTSLIGISAEVGLLIVADACTVEIRLGDLFGIMPGDKDIRLQWRDMRTVVFSLNTGVVDKLFYNRFHRQQVCGIPSSTSPCTTTNDVC